jgi:hypothetical protein
LATRLPCLREELSRNPQARVKLEEHYETARNPDAVVAKLGLREHPEVRTWKGSKVKTYRKWEILSRIVYRCDMLTLFGDLGGPRSVHARAWTRELNQAREAARVGAPAAGPLSFDSVIEHTAVEHLRALVPEGSVLSIGGIPAGEPVPQLLSLDESFGLRRGLAGPEEHHGQDRGGEAADLTGCLEPDIDAGQGDGVDGEQRGQAALATDWHTKAVFFKMLHPRPSKMRLARMPVASGGRLRVADIAVTVHAATHHTEQPCIMNDPVLLNGCAVMMMSGLKECGVVTLMERLHIWEVQPGTSGYAFRSLPAGDMQDQQSALQLLVAANAFPDTGASLEVSRDSADMPDILMWAREGLVTCSEADGGHGSVRVAFSAKGVQELTLSLRCHRPRAVCTVREGPVALEDRTSFELAVTLWENGWEWRPLPRKREERLALVYTPGGDQYWYSSTPIPEHRYLEALLLATDLFAKGVVAIPHWSMTPAQTYGEILAGRNPRRKRLLTLGGDIDAGRDRPVCRVPSKAAASKAIDGGAGNEDKERPLSFVIGMVLQLPRGIYGSLRLIRLFLTRGIPGKSRTLNAQQVGPRCSSCKMQASNRKA